MMDAPNQNETPRIEPLLDAWGAAEAGRRAGERLPPAPPVPPVHSGARWQVPLAAAASAVLAVGLWVLVGAHRGQVREPERLPVLEPPEMQPTQAAADQVAELRRELAAERLASAEAKAAIESKLTLLERRLAAVPPPAPAASPDPALAASVEELREQAREESERRERLEERLEALGAENASLRGSLAAQADALGEAARERENLVREIRAFRAEYEDLLGAVQRVHVAAAVPRTGDIGAIQSTARRTEIVRRGLALRPRVEGEDTARLFDALEVVLTRLDLLRGDEPGAADALKRLVERGELIDRIEAVLVSGAEDPRVRAWLLEARLLLVRAERVG